MAMEDHLLHTPDERGAAQCDQIRAKIIELDALLDMLCPQGRNLAEARTCLEYVRMWAIKAVVMQYPAIPLGSPTVQLQDGLVGPLDSESAAPSLEPTAEDFEALNSGQQEEIPETVDDVTPVLSPEEPTSETE